MLARADAGDFRALEGFLEVLMSRSLLDFLESLGTMKDMLLPLKELEKQSDYSSKYLALRASTSRYDFLSPGSMLTGGQL